MTNLRLVKDQAGGDRYADLTFGQWLRRLGKRLFLLVTAGWVVSFVTLLTGTVKELAGGEWPVAQLLQVTPDKVLQIVTIVNFIVIFAILLFPPRGPKSFSFDEGEPNLPDTPAREDVIRQMCGYDKAADWEKAKGIAITVLRQFEFVWMMLWVFWLLLSIPLLIGSFGPISGITADLLMMASMLFSNCNTLMMVFCYEILAQPTTVGVARLARPEVNWFRWIAIVIGFTFVQVFLIHVLHLPILEVFAWISGICAATAFALFVGRLDSRYLNPPTWFLVAMYMYVAIQPLFPLLGSAHPLIKALIINAALVFKCLLYLYIVWLFQSGRFLFYFVRVARVYQVVGDDWKHFADALDRAPR